MSSNTTHRKQLARNLAGHTGQTYQQALAAVTAAATAGLLPRRLDEAGMAAALRLLTAPTGTVWDQAARRVGGPYTAPVVNAAGRRVPPTCDVCDRRLEEGQPWWLVADPTRPTWANGTGAVCPTHQPWTLPTQDDAPAAPQDEAPAGQDEPGEQPRPWTCRHCGQTRDAEPRGADLRAGACPANTRQGAQEHLWLHPGRGQTTPELQQAAAEPLTQEQVDLLGSYLSGHPRIWDAAVLAPTVTALHLRGLIRPAAEGRGHVITADGRAALAQAWAAQVGVPDGARRVGDLRSHQLVATPEGEVLKVSQVYGPDQVCAQLVYPNPPRTTVRHYTAAQVATWQEPSEAMVAAYETAWGWR